ncbi:MAG: hydrogenase nickel incorporation protein HypB, partial [Deltaproteobacteria bacterium]|nr:hydrogenase nickel incorporation protein HypB [Deltaproteobacteria bacterium]
MCDVCGCGDPTRVTIDVHRSLLEDNDHEAEHLREHFAEHGVTVVNLMGSPGSGKTALLEATSRAFAGRRRLAAVSGDLATDLDADRLRRAGIASRSITTGSACHLDARMVHHALHEPALASAVGHADYFFVENVGNLVCPAIYDLGQRVNVVALSVTEGVDKPLKYPVMFQRADLVVITKVDLVPHLGDVSLDDLRANVERAKPGLPVIALSATTDRGVGEWTAWLE